MNSPKPLNISYLGDRDYIDVNTITNVLYEALPHIAQSPTIRNFSARIFKKITRECVLFFEQDYNKDRQPTYDKDAICIRIRWDFQGSHYSAYYVETGARIEARRPEAVDDPSPNMRYEKGAVILNEPINDDCTYNLMKMGKLIVVQKYGLIPRVVRFRFDRFYERSEMTGVVMTAVPLGHAGFYRLNIFRHDEKFGEILVKGFQ